MPNHIAFYQARLPIVVGKEHIELEQLQTVVRGVAGKLRGRMEGLGLHTECFHHHEEDGTPKLQPPSLLYQVSSRSDADRKKFATLTAFGEAAAALKWLLEHLPEGTAWNNQKELFLPLSTVEKTVEVNTANLPLREYKIFEYLPLSGLRKGKAKSNWELYLDATDFAERLELLHRLLPDQLRTLVENGWGIKPQSPPLCRITEITKITHDEVKSKSHPWLACNLTFACNWALPPDCAIGNRIGLGYGKMQLLPESTVEGTERYKSLRRLEQKMSAAAL